MFWFSQTNPLYASQCLVIWILSGYQEFIPSQLFLGTKFSTASSTASYLEPPMFWSFNDMKSLMSFQIQWYGLMEEMC